MLILHANRVGLRRAGKRFEDLQLEEVVLERQRGAGYARELLKHENLSKHVIAHMIAAVDDAESVEIEVHEIANHLIGQTHIGAPLRNRILVEIFSAEFAHMLDEHAIGLAKTEIHVNPLTTVPPSA